LCWSGTGHGVIVGQTMARFGGNAVAPGIARRLTRGGLIALAAFGSLAMTACDGNASTAAPTPTATTVSDSATTGSGTPAETAGSAATGGTGTAKGSGTKTSGPGGAQSLPDGTHDGYLTAVDTAKRTITFDKVELLTGEAARKAYQKKNPGVTDDPPNDYFLVNDNKLLRTLPVADGVTVSVIDVAKGSSVATTKSSFAKLPAFLADKDNSTLFKLSVKGGKVTALESIYLP
jgi:hypothetical protein